MKMKSVKKAVTLMLALLLAVGGILAVPSDVQAATKPTKITLSASKTTLTIGKTTTLKVKAVTPKKASKSVSFKSSNTKIASVNSKGVISAKKAGKATITVTSKLNKKVTAKCVVTVKTPTPKSIVVTNAVSNTVSVKKGKTLTLKATVTPTGAKVSGYTYSSSKKSVATVSSKGKITAKKAGKAVITIKAKGTKLSKKITVIVPSKAVTKVKLNKTTTSLNVGKTTTLKATISPSNATTKIVSWTSSNTSVATVSSKGVVKGIKAGTATITVKTLDGSKTAKCKVTVKQPVTSVKLNKTSLSLKQGESYTLKTTVAPSNASSKSVSWKSSNTKVATVSSKGAVKAVTAGTATITATAKDGSGKKATCKITVTAPTPPTPPTPQDISVVSVTLNKTSADLYVNDTVTLSATVAPTNATVKTITWKSSNTSVATVSNGIVKAVAVGTSTITATSNNGKSASCNITVNRKAPAVIDVTSVTLNKTTATIKANETLTLNASVAPSNATNKNISWETSNSAAATVNNGIVTPSSTLASNESVTITAKSISNPNVKAECVVSIVVSENALTTNNNTTFEYTFDKSATSYSVKRDSKAYALSESDITSDVATFKSELTQMAQSGMNANICFDKVTTANIRKFKVISSLFGFGSGARVDVIDSSTKKITASVGGRTVEMRLKLVNEDTINVTYNNKIVKITGISATTNADGSVAAYASINAGSQELKFVTNVSADGKMIQIDRYNGSFVVSYHEMASQYRVEVNKTYYNEILGMFGIAPNSSKDVLRTSQIYNCYN